MLKNIQTSQQSPIYQQSKEIVKLTTANSLYIIR